MWNGWITEQLHWLEVMFYVVRKELLANQPCHIQSLQRNIWFLRSKYCGISSWPTIQISRLHLFFDLVDVAMVSSFIIYKLHQNALSFLDFKLLVSKSLTGSITARTREFPRSRPTKRRLTQVVTDESQSHFPEYQ